MHRIMFVALLIVWVRPGEVLGSQGTKGDLPQAKRTALDQVAALDGAISRMAAQLWKFSEIALTEKESAAFLAGVLEEEGFALQREVAGMPTAFVAEWGEGRPIIGILAEFDALPNIGNNAVPRREPRSDGHPHGQGCGHNLFGAGSTGAAIALKRTMQEHGLKGTVRLYGTPAEETVVGKVYMANAGVFDDLDVALDWHPDVKTGVNNQAGQALNNFTVEFFGQAAHSAYDPWNGRSALDAVELMNHGMNMMREHIEPTARIHYVIPSGGEAPNVVPEYARVWYFVRDISREKVERNYAWALDIAAGAARATQTDHKVFLITGVHAMLLNRPLQEAAQKNLEIVGAPAYTEEEQSFARELQSFLKIEQKGLSTSIRPLAGEPELAEGGSTDVAEVSRITPTVSITVASAGEGLPWHSWATSASHGIADASRAAQVAARALALNGVDLLTDPDLLKRAHAFFLEQKSERPYQSPIPVDQKPPLPEGRQ